MKKKRGGLALFPSFPLLGGEEEPNRRNQKKTLSGRKREKMWTPISIRQRKKEGKKVLWRERI